MIIERIQAEEGWLAGLDLTFSDGLNVLIGARGTGKTSVIELIRFCLDVKGHTKKSHKRSHEHALSILGPGQVKVTLRNGEQRITISRTGEEEKIEQEASSAYFSPIIFSTNEIESVGLEAPSRLRLIDGFRSNRDQFQHQENYFISQIRSMTVEMRSLHRDVEALDTELKALPQLEDELNQVIKEERVISQKSDVILTKQKELENLSETLSSYTIRSNVFERTKDSIKEWKDKIDGLLSFSPTIESWPEETRMGDQLENVRIKVDEAIRDISDGSKKLENIIEIITTLYEDAIKERSPWEKQARAFRKEIEMLQEGAGEVAQKASSLREKLTHLNSLKSLREQTIGPLANLRAKRADVLDELDKVREQRFASRLKIADSLSKRLSPNIRVQVMRSAQYVEYASIISTALRGSGLKYTPLSKALAQNMSPRELVEAVEVGDFEFVADVTGITRERAAIVTDNIRENGVEDILTCLVEDDVGLELLDGNDYKNINDLSTGQRCTVILPIVLEHLERVLIVDQPEDNLDNAFIVETLIKAILNRKFHGQLIFSTHNANIPVLGDADQVILLGSSGKRGFVVNVGGLDEQATVNAITSVMEGGREAFERRAKFYRKYFPNLNG